MRQRRFRRFWNFWFVAAVCSGCALTFSYEDYERARGDASLAGSGASAGVNGDASFGGSAGTPASGGNAGTPAGGGTAASDGAAGTPASGGSDGGGSGGSAGTGPCDGNSDGQYCKGPLCVGNLWTGSICQLGVCQVQPSADCGAYKCNASLPTCPTTCVTSADCATGYVCDGTQHCTVDCLTCSQIISNPGTIKPVCSASVPLWNAIVACCPPPCGGVCQDGAKTALKVCGGTSFQQMPVSCKDCLTSNCFDEYNACIKDVP